MANKYSEINQEKAVTDNLSLLDNMYSLLKESVVDILKTKKHGFETALRQVLSSLEETFVKMDMLEPGRSDKYRAEIDEICNTDAANEKMETVFANQDEDENDKEKDEPTEKPDKPTHHLKRRDKEDKGQTAEYKPKRTDTITFDPSKKNKSGRYEFVNLPSKGECYPIKKENIEVSMLTAIDENLITSPNLYRNNTVIEEILSRKVVDESIYASSLVDGDADAISLWLRITSYGNEFPITVTDAATGKKFESVVDLSKLKYKEFNLKGDENGYFKFKLPKCGDEVKFRFLTKKEKKELTKANNTDDKLIAANEIVMACSTILDKMPTLSEEFEEDGYGDVIEVTTNLREFMVDYGGEFVPENTNAITNMLKAYIVSVNGNDDAEFLDRYCEEMDAFDSLKLRRYITENEPGVDFSVRIEKPKALGGGYIDTFLEWDETIFINIA